MADENDQEICRYPCRDSKPASLLHAAIYKLYRLG
jgi:hypothetical protein